MNERILYFLPWIPLLPPFQLPLIVLGWVCKLQLQKTGPTRTIIIVICNFASAHQVYSSIITRPFKQYPPQAVLVSFRHMGCEIRMYYFLPNNRLHIKWEKVLFLFSGSVLQLFFSTPNTTFWFVLMYKLYFPILITNCCCCCCYCFSYCPNWIESFCLDGIQ